MSTLSDNKNTSYADSPQYVRSVQDALNIGKTPKFKPVDPILFIERFWPSARLYKTQWSIVESVEYNRETVVSAGNKLGKDYVSSLIALSYFLRHPEVRIITTSVKDDHLRILWAEIQRHIDTCRFPLSRVSGGPLIINHRDIKKFNYHERSIDNISYMRGMVSSTEEGFSGHHSKATLAIIDEASGVNDSVYSQLITWSNRILIIGNPNPCQNFFYKAVKGGDILSS